MRESLAAILCNHYRSFIWRRVYNDTHVGPEARSRLHRWEDEGSKQQLMRSYFRHSATSRPTINCSPLSISIAVTGHQLSVTYADMLPNIQPQYPVT